MRNHLKIPEKGPAKFVVCVVREQTNYGSLWNTNIELDACCGSRPIHALVWNASVSEGNWGGGGIKLLGGSKVALSGI